MLNIGIVGAGIAGLHLGLFLRQHGVAATIYADRTAEQLRADRLLNNPVRFAHTRARERALGVDRWAGVAPDLTTVSVSVTGAHPLAFTGRLAEPGSYVDMRLYQPALLEEFAARGGAVVFGAVTAEDLVGISERHDLVVVAAGRGSLAELFPRVAARSPYDRPQRRLFLGYFQGVTADPNDVAFIIAPGQGEAFLTTTYAQGGPQTALLVAAIPGGALEPITRMRYEDDPRHFELTLLGLFREHAAPIAATIDPAAFRLTRPVDLLQGAVTPTVRESYTRLPNRRYALAIGDVQLINDPLAAQGANAASYAGWAVGEAVVAGFSPDEAFCRRVAEGLWAYTGPVTALSNFLLEPPPPHLLALLAGAAQHQALADAFANGFNTPVETWELLRSPAAVAALLDAFGVQEA